MGSSPTAFISQTVGVARFLTSDLWADFHSRKGIAPNGWGVTTRVEVTTNGEWMVDGQWPRVFSFVSSVSCLLTSVFSFPKERVERAPLSRLKRRSDTGPCRSDTAMGASRSCKLQSRRVRWTAAAGGMPLSSAALL